MKKKTCKIFRHKLAVVICLVSLFFLNLSIVPVKAAENYLAIANNASKAYMYDSNIYYVPINANKTLGAKVKIETINGYSFNRGIGVADFDNDGDYDIIYAHGASQNLYLYRKTGAGATFSGAEDKGDFIGTGDGGELRAEDMAVADFNSDGNMDFLLSGYNNKLQVYLGNGNGDFTQLPYQSVPVAGILLGKDAADVNGDGFMDVVTAFHHGDYLEQNRLYVWFGNDDGTFQAPLAVYNSQDVCGWNCWDYNPFGYGLVTDDYDCDGVTDLLITINHYGTGNSNLLMMMRGHGDGYFDDPSYIGPLNFSYSIMPADRFNFTVGDSNPDVAIIVSPPWGTNIQVWKHNNNCENFQIIFKEAKSIDYELSAIATPRQIECVITTTTIPE